MCINCNEESFKVNISKTVLPLSKKNKIDLFIENISE